MYSTLRRLILLGFLVCLSLACGGGQSSDQLVSSTEKITEDQSSKETSGANLIPPGSSGGGSNIASNTPSKGAIANGGTERSSTSLPMLKFFDPTEDGFGFTNFAGGSGAATIGVNDLVELFGSDGLCIPGDSGICEPYPGVDLFLGQLNAVLANGLCYGISASVTNHFSGDRILGGIGPETKALVDLNRGDELDHSIAKLHMMQFSEEYRAALDTYLDDRPDEIARELKASFEDPGNGSTPPYTLALYTDEGGHAITPIGIEETESGYRVSVYDSNWPRETRWVDMDGDSWEYQGSAVLITEDKNSGGGLWTGQGAGTMALIPHAFPDDGFDCFFCQETGSGLSKSTGSVIMVNAQDIKNTTFEMASDDGQEMTWTTSGRSGRLESVKTYILPSQSESLDGGSDILMVVVPPEVNNFEVNLTPLNGSNEEIDQADSFGLVLVGPGIPTTVTKGHILEAPEEDSTNIIEFSKDPLTDTVVLSIDSEKVETIESATIQSTTFVELASDERYEAIIVEDALDDVVVAQKETAEVVFSLKAILDDVETPLRTTETGDGLRFSKFSDGSVTVESPDNDLINKTVDAGYEVTFSDGTTASFQISEDRAMIGNFSDGSTSIRFKSGNGVHSTADGWVINEPTRGEYEVLRENLEGVLERPSLDALAQNFTIAAETKEMMRDLIFDEESQRDPKNDPLFGVEGDVGVADVVSVNTERAEILYDKYELLKQVREVIALETQDIGSNVFVQATLGSMETTDWSVKLEAEQKSWADEMETAEAIVVAEQETSAESTSETTGEAESESEANAGDELEARYVMSNFPLPDPAPADDNYVVMIHGNYNDEDTITFYVGDKLADETTLGSVGSTTKLDLIADGETIANNTALAGADNNRPRLFAGVAYIGNIPAPDGTRVSVKLNDVIVAEIITESKSEDVSTVSDSASIFAGLSENLTTAWRFINQTQTWSFYDPEDTFNNLNTYLDASAGHIVYLDVLQDQLWESIQLQSGLNIALIPEVPNS